MLHRTFTYVHLSCSLRSWRDFARVLLFWTRSREGICPISLAAREFPRGARKKMAERSLPNPASYAGYSVPVTSLPVLNVQLIMLISFNMFFAHYSLQHLVVGSVVVIDVSLSIMTFLFNNTNCVIHIDLHMYVYHQAARSRDAATAMIMELAVHKDIKVTYLSLLLKISMNDLTLN